MISLSKGFCNTYNQLEHEFRKVGFSFACKDIYVPNKIFNVFGSIAYKKPLNNIMKLITKALLGKKTHYLYVLGKINYANILK